MGFCPEGVGASGGYDGCDGLRSGPGIGDLGCFWCTEVAGFAAGPRHFAYKRSVARSASTPRVGVSLLTQRPVQTPKIY
ncbi:hypothetical protein CFN58_31565 [Pseudomonas avellanae]|uniref:Thiamine monophosphate kinase n=2 Tax=Pseudomonas syringae group TaxID=136849 RepID=A0A2G9L878_PSESF|nr:hypothetical protein CT122_30700 [Pseudomonas syringae pv. actinidiae]MBL3835688.1 hypothetical protein [Pseudomonas syringae pv. theae]OZI83379.1 hypothetical protein CFN58_31565 [Pseudomonas avellanae]PIN62714.1 hypothetical protein CUB86_04160 [Pseudomonas syringae pv. actinidiae]GBH13003.1 Thiamine monophosphate kinase [Pseudomonas syringae pv. actinidiae]